MWTSDLVLPQTEPPAIYLAAKVGSAPAVTAKSVHRLGVCSVINSERVVFPTGDAETYVSHYLAKNFDFDFKADGSERTDAQVRIIKLPQHGELVQEYPDATDFRRHHYKYVPDDGFLGYDHFVMEASAGGYKVRVYYTMSVRLPTEPTYVFNEKGERADDLEACPKAQWKISSTPQALNLASLQSETALSTLLARAAQSLTGVADLPASTLAQTTGEGEDATITLDTTAAGHGWFIDTTPDSHDEFLPTADPTVWKARPDSAAAGKMDLLSVLLHEYGHALGIEHSSVSTDFMAPALQPGERRLPSAEEFAMWFAEPPVAPDQMTALPIFIAQAARPGKERALGVCDIVQTNTGRQTKTSISPAGDAKGYMFHYEGQEINFGYGDGNRVTVLLQPKHGILQKSSPEDLSSLGFDYLPNKDYSGDDLFVIQAEKDGIKVNIHYFVRVLDFIGRNPYDSNCDVTTNPWRISSSGGITDSIAKLLPRESWTFGQANVTVMFGELAGGALGETTGEGEDATITLDTTAAGHGIKQDQMLGYFWESKK